MEITSVVVYMEDGAVPAVLEFYKRVLGLTRRFYDPDYQFGELAGCGAATARVAAHSTGEGLMPAGYERPSLGTRVTNIEVAFTTDDVVRSRALLQRGQRCSLSRICCLGVRRSRTPGHRMARSWDCARRCLLLTLGRAHLRRWFPNESLQLTQRLKSPQHSRLHTRLIHS